MNAEKKSWTESYGMNFDPVSHSVNTDPAYFELEREKIFKKSWINICRIDELSEPGSFVVKEIEVWRTSVVITRDPAGKLHAFHNSCRHRGNKIVMSGAKQAGLARGFMCVFHGWTYDLAGKLTYVPDEEAFCKKLDHDDLSLKAISIDVWRGFVFLNLQTPPAQSLVEFLGEWGRRTSEYPFETMKAYVRYSVTAACNWKIFMDAFQEGYHVCTLHRKGAYKPFASKENPFAHMYDLELFPSGHRRFSFPANLEFEPTFSTQLAMKFAPSNIYGYNESAGGVGGVNRAGRKDWAFDLGIVFPNTQFLLGNGWFLYYNYWPIAVDKTRFEARYYLLPASNAAERVSIENSEAALRDVLQEDFCTVEDTQASLKSGAISHMQLSDEEVSCRFNYDLIDRLVRVGES